VSDALTVHVNEDGIHTLRADASEIETGGSFAVVLSNHGSPSHVHVRLDGDLAKAASLDAGNHFVDANAERVVNIAVRDAARPVEGALSIFTGYGSESVTVPVRVREPRETDEGIPVAEEFTEKPTPENDRSLAEFAPAMSAALGVLLAVTAIVTFSGVVALVVAVLLLAFGLAVAAFLATQG